MNQTENRFPRRKVNTFLLFLLASFMAWLISKLSDTHTDQATFELEYINVPDSLILAGASKQEVGVRLEATGFQFLGFNFNKHKVAIDLTELTHDGNRFLIPAAVYREQVEKQLPASMEIRGMDRENIYLDFNEISEKPLPVVSRLSISLGKNHMMDSIPVIDPDTVMIRGPINEIDTIKHIYTRKKKLTDITEDFTEEVALKMPDGLRNTRLDREKVQVSAKVFRFSELILEVPVEVQNLPEGTEIKTFPPNLPLLIKADVERLKSLSPNDFRLIADFSAPRENENFLSVSLRKKPSDLHSVEIEDREVEFILKRQ
ncbi:CdaR family protein [Zeaxanthinibacter enoshimensis]|uniref:YbbR-like protein n=1 Tax=Zeaxanthinibacter enoshimensis TaxID=392009 RepID=A0A4R6TM42_9FLAO|nr:CdaR family protein [Zeaxanthinibacter enoshimensis]TDQ31622.1 YbbR-like protein [Zeaxanthinibacter enoshimensis]